MKIYIAKMPEVFGYGYTAFSEINALDAVEKIKAHYALDFKDRNGYAPDPHDSNEKFYERFEFYGGTTNHLDLTSVYCESLSDEYMDIEDKELCAEEMADKRLRRNPELKAK